MTYRFISGCEPYILLNRSSFLGKFPSLNESLVFLKSTAYLTSATHPACRICALGQGHTGDQASQLLHSVSALLGLPILQLLIYF